MRSRNLKQARFIANQNVKRFKGRQPREVCGLSFSAVGVHTLSSTAGPTTHSNDQKDGV